MDTKILGNLVEEPEPEVKEKKEDANASLAKS
jgi:hypothetical protein